MKASVAKASRFCYHTAAKVWRRSGPQFTWKDAAMVSAQRWGGTILAVLFIAGSAPAQTVNVKFRYQPQASYVRVHFPGQFNNWGPNSSGTIAAGAPSQADSLEASTDLWVKTIPLAFGTYQYKIYRQLSPTANDWSWIPDPLNRVVIPPDQNSQFVVDSLVLFEISAYPYTIETGFVVRTGVPKLSAGVFQPAGSPQVAINGWVDGVPIANPMGSFDQASGIFTYVPVAGLADGIHTFTLTATAGTNSKTDSVRFEVRARPVQIQTPPFVTRKSAYVTAGIILKPDGSGPDSSVSSLTLTVGGTLRVVPASNGTFADNTPLAEGPNTILVSTASGKDSVVVTRIVDHTPMGSVTATIEGASIVLDATGSVDPDGQTLTDFRWFDDSSTPLGLTGQTGVSATVAKPRVPGEYYFGLIVVDPSGNADTTRSYFTILPDSSLQNPGIASNPSWARKARVYFLFPKAYTSQGTLSAATAQLQRVRDLGFSVIWVMPVMVNASPINQGSGPGYNIVDFNNVAPEYGSNQDFKNFVSQAHALGLKVILDVTPNHTGRNHPWAANARLLGQNSPYWNWYQHTIIPHNDNGLGQSLDAYGFNYYSGFSDQLLNYNWTDIDARTEMIRVYQTWIKTFGIDGYRFDVYWGPHRRYGEQFMGDPVRRALKHVKPDILLLGEDDGTGTGTEVIYADRSNNGVVGGLDAAYDFKLYFNQIRGFGFTPTAVSNLNNEAYNGGFYPGPNALYMRFMESQDEDRITYFYSNAFSIDATTTFQRTMPMASVLFTVPGFPMVWNGQEVGWGYGISGSKDSRTRSTINWAYQGKDLLSPHYQKLAHIRGQFPAFTWHKQDSNHDGSVTALDAPDFVQLATTDGTVYAFARPFTDQNGVTVANFSANNVSVTVDATAAGALLFSQPVQGNTAYYLNNLYANTQNQILGSQLNSIGVSLPPYGTAVFTVSTTPDTLKIATPFVGVNDRPTLPQQYALDQNYPNPFNPSTTIRYSLAESGLATLKVYDILGQEIATLVEGQRLAGQYAVAWDGRNRQGSAVGSGVYLYRLAVRGGSGGGFVSVRKMTLVR
jgi:cyclomaltodextrinase / maltogenic alpha-amylase / neopullulanase